MFKPEDLRARIQRLQAIARELAAERLVPPVEDNDPLLYVERLAYRLAMDRGLYELEGARVVLAKALDRMGERIASK
jgi:hypothetical protein